MEVIDDCFVVFFRGILPMTQQVSRTVKKKKQLEEKTKKLKFNLSLMSCCVVGGVSVTMCLGNIVVYLQLELKKAKAER